MIAQLTISNYILIDHLELRFHPGLNIVTGETGAGKSILMDALGLLSGNRADAKSLRNPDRKCIVEAWFSGITFENQDLPENVDLDPAQEIIVRREILPGGKSRAFINDSPATLEILRQVAGQLFDIHGQQDTLDLGRAETQIKTLDLLAGTTPTRLRYQQEYASWRAAAEKLKKLEDRRDTEAAAFSYQSFLFNELEEAALKPGEQELLENEIALSRNGEEIKSRLHFIVDTLEGQGSLNATLKILTATLEKLGTFSPEFAADAARMKSVWLELRDLASGLEEQNGKLSLDPLRMQALEERLSTLYTLQKKHRKDSVNQLVELREGLRKELDDYTHLDDHILLAQSELKSCFSSLQKTGTELHTARVGKVELISATLVGLLQDMGMPKARFEIEIIASDPGPSGLDKIRFLFSANPGLALSELRQSASGGEFSRLMLALKCLMAKRAEMPSLIFDEIDTGISGEVAMKVGRIIRELSDRHQVMAITHSPQMASRAQAHWFVYKILDEDTTQTSVRLLDEKEHLEEIAKMISGDTPSPAALKTAQDLIASFS
jgi:DNA repair protein RecN (Recombination protein N)